MRSVRFRIWRLALLLGSFGVPASTGTAQAVTLPPLTLADKLTSLAGRAALIFSGQVCSIQRRGGVMEITFTVEQALLGTPGSRYVLREWAGLWPPGQFRYTLGERALIFLHGTSTAGFASPVDGAEGVLPVIAQGANAPQLVDVRRLSAAVLRTPGTPLATEANGAWQLTDAISLVNEVTRPSATGRSHHLQAPFRLPARGLPTQRAEASFRVGETASALSPDPSPQEHRSEAAAHPISPAVPVLEVNREIE